MEQESVEEARARFTAFFHLTDTDKSGSLSMEEFKVMLEKGGYTFTPEQMQANFASLDADGDNTISLEEFLQAMTGIPMVDHRRAMWRKAFLAWDADHSGDVDRHELRQVFRDVVRREMTDQELERVFRWLDKDQNGKIEWEEFVSYFLNMSKNFID